MFTCVSFIGAVYQQIENVQFCGLTFLKYTIISSPKEQNETVFNSCYAVTNRFGFLTKQQDDVRKAIYETDFCDFL